MAFDRDVFSYITKGFASVILYIIILISSFLPESFIQHYNEKGLFSLIALIFFAFIFFVVWPVLFFGVVYLRIKNWNYPVEIAFRDYRFGAGEDIYKMFLRPLFHIGLLISNFIVSGLLFDIYTTMVGSEPPHNLLPLYLIIGLLLFLHVFVYVKIKKRQEENAKIYWENNIYK